MGRQALARNIGTYAQIPGVVYRRNLRRIIIRTHHNEVVQRVQHRCRTRIREPVIIPSNTPRNTDRFLVEGPVRVRRTVVRWINRITRAVAPVRENARTGSLYIHHVCILSIQDSGPIVARIDKSEQAERHRREVAQVVSRIRALPSTRNIARIKEIVGLIDFMFPQSGNERQSVGQISRIARFIIGKNQRRRNVQVRIRCARIIRDVPAERRSEPRH